MEQGVEGGNQNSPNGKTAAITELSWKPLIDPWMGQQKCNGQGSKEQNGAVAGGETPPKNKKQRTEDNTQINETATPTHVDIFDPQYIFLIRLAERFVGPVKRVGLLQPKGFQEESAGYTHFLTLFIFNDYLMFNEIIMHIRKDITDGTCRYVVDNRLNDHGGSMHYHLGGSMRRAG